MTGKAMANVTILITMKIVVMIMEIAVEAMLSTNTVLIAVA